jgi:hypothetical protein
LLKNIKRGLLLIKSEARWPPLEKKTNRLMYNSTPLSFRWSIPLTIEQEGKLSCKSPIRMWPWPFLVSHAARVSTGITSKIQNSQKWLSFDLSICLMLHCCLHKSVF